jgi:hypothetical protein
VEPLYARDPPPAAVARRRLRLPELAVGRADYPGPGVESANTPGGRDAADEWRDAASAQSLSLSVHRSAASFGSNACFCGVAGRRFETYSPLSEAASGDVASQMSESAPCSGVLEKGPA